MPTPKVIATVRKAKAKFHTTIRRNEPRMVALVSTLPKLRNPTLTFQPCASALPEGSTNVPFLLSAVNFAPVVLSMMQSQLLS
jgi:hypothetical protein